MPYIEPTNDTVIAMLKRGIEGPVVMLNLLRFRETADYSATPELGGDKSISGEAAYRIYSDHALPFLTEAGGQMLFYGKGGNFVIGPEDVRWDAAMLVQYPDVEAFLSFAQNPGYLAGLGHRTAALEDSRLLPLSDFVMPI